MSSYKFNFIENQNICKNIDNEVCKFSNHEFDEFWIQRTYKSLDEHATNLTNMRNVWRIRNKSWTCNKSWACNKIYNWAKNHFIVLFTFFIERWLTRWMYTWTNIRKTILSNLKSIQKVCCTNIEYCLINFFQFCHLVQNINLQFDQYRSTKIRNLYYTNFMIAHEQRILSSRIFIWLKHATCDK